MGDPKKLIGISIVPGQSHNVMDSFDLFELANRMLY